MHKYSNKNGVNNVPPRHQFNHNLQSNTSKLAQVLLRILRNTVIENMTSTTEVICVHIYKFSKKKNHIIVIMKSLLIKSTPGDAYRWRSLRLAEGSWISFIFCRALNIYFAKTYLTFENTAFQWSCSSRLPPEITVVSSLTSRSRIHSEKLTFAQLVNKFLAFGRTPVRNSPPFVLFLA
jgi:hypothetical protein